MLRGAESIEWARCQLLSVMASLVWAEAWQEVRDEVVEASESLSPAGRPGAVGVGTPAGVGQVGEHGPVEVVERSRHRVGPGDGADLGGRSRFWSS